MKKKPNKWTTVYIVQGNYGAGWEDVSGSVDRKDERATLKDYRTNDPHPHRMIRRRVLTVDAEAGNF